MAQLRDLLVNGASRFLGVVNFNDEAIFNEGVTLNETLTLLKNTDANGSTYNCSVSAHMQYNYVPNNRATKCTLYIKGIN